MSSQTPPDGFFSQRLGSHSGQNQYVSIESVNDLMVNSHESIHGHIFNTTADGQLQSLLGQLLDSLANETDEDNTPPRHFSSQSAGQLRELVTYLNAVSEPTQEIAATYLGIKSTSADQHDLYLDHFPRSYLISYNTLSQAIDPIIPTSYLQYIVGWSMTLVSFSSAYCHRFSLAGFEDITWPTHEELPSTRLSSIISTLSSRPADELFNLLSEIGSNICRERGIRPWDFSSEEEWWNAGKVQHSFVVELESELTNRTCLHIAEITGLPFLNAETRREPFELLLRILNEKGFSVGMEEELFAQLGLSRELSKCEKDAIFDAIAAGDGKIFNRHAKSYVATPMRDNNEFAELLANCDHISIVGRPTFSEESDWTLCFWSQIPNEGRLPTTVKTCRNNCGWRILTNLKAVTSELSNNITTLLEVTDPDSIFETSAWILEEFSSTMDLENIAPYMDGQLLWYWSANWTQMIISLSLLASPIRYVTICGTYASLASGVEFEAVSPQIYTEVHARLPDFCLKVAKWPGCPGTIIRMTNVILSERIRHVESILAEQGRIVTMSEEEVSGSFNILREGCLVTLNVLRDA